jgi:hypothetical protein
MSPNEGGSAKKMSGHRIDWAAFGCRCIRMKRHSAKGEAVG